jgi:5'-nucleotidase
VQDSVTLNGKPLQPAAAYRVTVNSFLADGGDRLAVLREGRERTTGPAALDALVRYLEERSPVAPAQERRVRNVGDQ